MAPAYIEKAVDDNIIANECVIAMAKNTYNLTNFDIFIKFLKPWYNIVDRSAETI